MTNEIRTLLLNLDAAPRPWYEPGEEYVPPDFHRRVEGGATAKVRRCLFGANADRTLKNYRLAQVMPLIHGSELADVAGVDPRLTYWPADPASRTFESVFTSKGPAGTTVLVEGAEDNGPLIHRWLVDYAAGAPATFTVRRLLGPDANTPTTFSAEVSGGGGGGLPPASTGGWVAAPALRPYGFASPATGPSGPASTGGWLVAPGLRTYAFASPSAGTPVTTTGRTPFFDMPGAPVRASFDVTGLASKFTVSIGIRPARGTAEILADLATGLNEEDESQLFSGHPELLRAWRKHPEHGIRLGAACVGAALATSRLPEA